jgi:hypothetical protein
MAETRERDAEVDEQDGEAEQQAAVGLQPHATVTPLTVPCTLAALRRWINGIDGLIVDNTSQITATATGISVA